MNPKEYLTQLGDDLLISRVVTGLWQIADMERDGQSLDLDAAARAMASYAESGLTSFDMADHYGSAEEIAGIFTRRYAGERGAQVFTKWVPTPGPSSRESTTPGITRMPATSTTFSTCRSCATRA